MLKTKGLIVLKLEHILSKVDTRQFLSTEEIVYILNLDKEEEIQKFYAKARELRHKYFDDKIFLYGFVYFSTWCRNDCAFCYYRKSNTEVDRYRKNRQEIIDTAVELAESGVHLLDLTMGEDPVYHSQGGGFNSFMELVSDVKARTQLPIMVSPGLVSEDNLKKLAAVGADWYACYQETHNQKLFEKLRLDQSYDERYQSKINAQRVGILAEEGLLAGVGETLEDIALSMESMRDLGTQQVRVMTFVPQKGSLMENRPANSRDMEIKIIALLRLLFPDRLIPASLDIDGVEGLQVRLDAGANVITSIIPPTSGLAGVAQSSKDIKEGFRTVKGVTPILDKMGLRKADLAEYQDWVNSAKEKLTHNYQKTGVQA